LSYREPLPDSELVEHFERADDVWSSALASPELRAVARALDSAAIGVDECVRQAATITELSVTRQRLADIRRSVVPSIVGVAQGDFERFVLGHAALRYRRDLQSAAVSSTVKRLTVSGVARFADRRAVVDLAEDRFVALCKMATVRRFAAGQFDWERSGLPRSWLRRVRPFAALMRLLSIVAFEWRGFGPALFAHFPAAYPVHVLLERETLKAYHRMAESMKLQPEMKGFIASAWLHSPATFEVSPHLAWLNKVFAEHGAVMATMGPASPDSGVLSQSAERLRAFTEGRFRPSLGLVVWRRQDMLAWAEAHPELGQ
jgi:hypothetical protein